MDLPESHLVRSPGRQPQVGDRSLYSGVFVVELSRIEEPLAIVAFRKELKYKAGANRPSLLPRFFYGRRISSQYLQHPLFLDALQAPLQKIDFGHGLPVTLEGVAGTFAELLAPLAATVSYPARFALLVPAIGLQVLLEVVPFTPAEISARY